MCQHEDFYSHKRDAAAVAHSVDSPLDEHENNSADEADRAPSLAGPAEKDECLASADQKCDAENK